MFQRIVLIFVLGVLIKGSTVAQNLKQYDREIDSLLAIMTLEEKVGQMTQYADFWNPTGPAPSKGQSKLKYDNLRKGLVGSILGMSGAEEVRKLQEVIVNDSRLGIPLIFGYDVIHGHRTLSPIPLAESASWDMEAIKRSAEVAAIEAAASGVNWTFAPMVDISRDARWGRCMEGAGEDPYLGSAIARARVQGFQGEDLADPLTVAACAKHFAAYGFAEAGLEYNTVDIGTATLHNIVLPPFKAAAEAGAATFMNGFNILNGVPVTANSYLQRDLLKAKWNFEGFIVSDWASIGEMVFHGFATDLKESAQIGANAGSDMDMEAYAYAYHLKDLVEEGKVRQSVVDDAVRRILRVKFALGLFDDPYRYCDEAREKELVYNEAHTEAVLEMANKSIVLLKNKGDILPLRKGQNIGVIGQLADDKNSMLGGWRIGSVDSSGVSVLEGLQSIMGKVPYARGPQVFLNKTEFVREVKINETDRSGWDDAINLAKKSEVVVMVLGEHGFQSGEGRSRTQLDLPGLQQELLEAVHSVNPNIVLVLANGRPLVLSWADENIPAILECWQLGSQAGNAIAQTLFGNNNPSGKLPMSFPRSVGQVPIYYNHFNTSRPDSLDIVFWSHYSDERKSPLYPFGYGLSYTTFDYSALKIDQSNRPNIQVSVNVKNTGSRGGEEVVQLYIRDKVGRIVRPVKELKGFDKIALAPRESKTVSFTLRPEDLGYYLPNGEFFIEAGEFDVMVGTSSQEGLSGSFRLEN